MSFAGITAFKKNLDVLMSSETFKKADDSARLRMGGLLLRSKFGAGSFAVGVRELDVDEKQSQSYSNIAPK